MGFATVCELAGLVSYQGTTTADGAPHGSTLIDSDLRVKPDYDGNLVVITSGDYNGQARDINGATTGGTVTPGSPFGGQIVEGTTFVIIGIRTVPAEVADIEGKLDHATHGLAALKALIDTVEGKLDSPDDFKADVSALALEATLTAIKGAGWTNETLKAIKDAIDALTCGDATQAKQDAIEGKLDKLADIQIREAASGSKAIDAGVTKYLHIDSGTNGAEILAIIIEGVIGHDWTLDVYVPAADAEAATQAKSKRDAITYAAADAEGGLLGPFGIAFDMYLDFTNDGANDTIDQVIVVYRSRETLTLTWET